MARSRPQGHSSVMSYNYEGLEPIYIETAKKELKEDPKKVLAHIASLRNWLKQCRHIQNCPDDDAFLLRFLRVAKFDHESAQSRLDNFCTLRGSKTRGAMSIFNHLTMENAVKKYFDFVIPCGYNSKGEIVAIVSTKSWDPAEMSYADSLVYLWMASEVLLEDERAQIAGVTAILDFDGFSKKHFDAMLADHKALKDNTKVWQEGSTVRNKDVYYYREPLIFDIIFNLTKIWIKPKILKRLCRVKNDLSKIHAKMPSATEILPKEYGGTNGTLEELKQKWIEKMTKYYSVKSRYNSIVVDESLRPQETLKFLNEYQDISGDMYGAKGTFTKIEAD